MTPEQAQSILWELRETLDDKAGPIDTQRARRLNAIEVAVLQLLEALAQ